MNQEIFFMPLGGGQRVGASCYFLRIGNSNIILDAGIGRSDGLEFEPDFRALLTSPFLQSMGQIDRVFISHAHADHVGSLLRLMKQSPHIDVYMTEITKALTGFLLYDRKYTVGKKNSEEHRLAAEKLLSGISTVSFMQTMDFGEYKVTFYPAGHIPGAMMVLFEVGRRKILYTGDYSLNGTALTSGCSLPENAEIDTVILCGLHAKNPECTQKSDVLFQKAHQALTHASERKQSVRCFVPQLSKGIEFLKTLNSWNAGGVPIYLDSGVLRVVEKMEQMSVPLLERHNRLMPGFCPREPHIYLTSEAGKAGGDYWDMKVDFTLHENFEELGIFLKKINPKQAVLVHCAKPRAENGTIEQKLMAEAECRTQFIFAEEKEIYQL